MKTQHYTDQFVVVASAKLRLIPDPHPPLQFFTRLRSYHPYPINPRRRRLRAAQKIPVSAAFGEWLQAVSQSRIVCRRRLPKRRFHSLPEDRSCTVCKRTGAGVPHDHHRSVPAEESVLDRTGFEVIVIFPPGMPGQYGPMPRRIYWQRA